ncbi:hypothetical protein [Shewanella sp. SM69]|uniref:hypothetical protein n=1 Tax=Shewanella TaxID=22 RepID=UPI0021D8F42A|nr:hypothetical protein [Shewanella sp. SM69]MCU8036969.1 hypothetical protein [Shewanella sp. SM69]
MKDTEIEKEINFWQDKTKSSDGDLAEVSNDKIKELIKLRDKNKNDRTQMFIVLWILCGVTLSVLIESSLILAWSIAIVLSAVYAYGFYKK